jgi:hypothetical protein
LVYIETIWYILWLFGHFSPFWNLAILPDSRAPPALPVFAVIAAVSAGPRQSRRRQ